MTISQNSVDDFDWAEARREFALLDASPLPLLPKESWEIKMHGTDQVLAGIFEHPQNCRYWKKISLIDLPNDLVSAADLARFGITKGTQA